MDQGWGISHIPSQCIPPSFKELLDEAGHAMGELLCHWAATVLVGTRGGGWSAINFHRTCCKSPRMPKKRQSMDGSNMVTISLRRKLATHLQRRWDLEKQNGKGPPRRKQWVGPFVLLILSRILAGVWNLGQLVKPHAQT